MEKTKKTKKVYRNWFRRRKMGHIQITHQNRKIAKFLFQTPLFSQKSLEKRKIWATEVFEYA